MNIKGIELLEKILNEVSITTSNCTGDGTVEISGIESLGTLPSGEKYWSDGWSLQLKKFLEVLPLGEWRIPKEGSSLVVKFYDYGDWHYKCQFPKSIKIGEVKNLSELKKLLKRGIEINPSKIIEELDEFFKPEDWD